MLRLARDDCVAANMEPLSPRRSTRRLASTASRDGAGILWPRFAWTSRQVADEVPTSRSGTLMAAWTCAGTRAQGASQRGLLERMEDARQVQRLKRLRHGDRLPMRCRLPGVAR